MTLEARHLQMLATLLDRRQIISDPAELIPYEVDAATERGTPDAVIFPASSEQAARVVKWARAEAVPIIGRGAGTGLSGGSIAQRGGIVVEFSKLNRVVELDVAGRSAVVEPGVVNQDLDLLARHEGLYYPPDPASGRSATLGGNIAENAGGPHCFKYGVTTNYVTGLEVVLADGRIVHLGGRALDYPEYDVVGILNGSEGTLGLVTRAEVRLIRTPPGVKTMVCAFDTVEQAGLAVSAVIAAGLVPATMEMMDRRIMRIVEEYVHAGLPIHRGALLIVEVDGYPSCLDAQIDEIAHLLERHGAQETRIAQTAEERERLWYGRKSAAGAMARLAPSYFLVDGTVPRSRLAETLSAIDKVCSGLDLQVGYVFHAGDGNLHPFIPVAPSDSAQVRRAWEACRQIMHQVVQREGSITGEHGVGIEKREFMTLMYDGAELAAMRDLKQVFDPTGIMNPGKVLPEQLPEPRRFPPLADMPSELFAPATDEQAAAGLAALTAMARSAFINLEREGATTISTRNLSGIKRYAPDDLYLTAGAGTTLAEVQAFLAPRGRQLPLASPWPGSTLGGIVAANLNTPQRMRYGAIRDAMLCCTVALADGRLIRAGRALVKNVAGYDLAKLFVGSYGSLGLITEVTFKLLPLPRASRTLLVPVDDLQQGLKLGGELLRVALIASGIVLAKGVELPGIQSPYALAYTAEGMPEEVAAELAQARGVLKKLASPAAIEHSSPTATELWARLLGRPSPGCTQIRAGVPPKDLASFVMRLAPELEAGEFLADIAGGLVYAATDAASPVAVEAWVSALRASALALGGYAVVTALPAEFPKTIDRWGYQPDALDLVRALRARFDPAGILNSGIFLLS